jgi:3-oxoadipate enol-lactonase
MQLMIDGRSLGCTSQGQGIPLLLMHGFPLNRTMFDAQVEALSGVSRVVTFDVPGLGESGPGPVSVAGIADLAASVLSELGIKKAVVGGVSMGGYASFAFARRYPERLLGLLLADTRPASDSPEVLDGRQAAAGFVTTNGVSEWAQQVLPRFVGATTMAARPDVVRDVRQMVESAPAQVVIDLLHALATREDSQNLLSEIAVPTLVITGEEDEITPAAAARERGARIAGAEIVGIASAGHLANMEHPKAFNEAVIRFLRGFGQ